MIARLRAWLGRTDHLAAARAELRQVHKALSAEQRLTARLTTEAEVRSQSNDQLRLRTMVAEAEAARLREDHAFVQAERCECGGDTELYWRTQARALEVQAGHDRANALRMADEIERLRLRVDEADRLVHIAEQLERAR